MLTALAASPLILRPLQPFEKHGESTEILGARKLRLYIHGAVVLDVQPNGLVLHAPKVTMSGKLAHDYRAGYGTNGEGDEIYPGCPLALLGVKGASSMPVIDKTAIPYLGPRALDTTQNHCSLITPVPTNLATFRQIPWDSSCGDFFPGVPELQQLRSLPTGLRADFDLQPGELAILVGAAWKDDGVTNPLTLHFRAEPGDVAYADHDAFLAMSMTLGLQVRLTSGYTKAAAKYKDKEERTLLEVIQGSTGGGVTVAPCSKSVPIKDKNYLLASRPANCVGIAINNSGN
jgi:hypothetical protein